MRYLGLGCLSIGLGLALVLVSFADSSSTDQSSQTLQNQRLSEEANAIINPSSMQTVSQPGSAPSKVVNPLTDAALAPTPSDTAVTPTPVSKLPVSKTAISKTVVQNQQPLGVMSYYDSLLVCKPGLFEFDNPAYTGTSQKQSITTSIEGLQGGYCVVDVYLSGSSMKTNCLFSNADRKELADKKARDAFSDAYAQGALDSGIATPYDKLVSTNCQSE